MVDFVRDKVSVDQHISDEAVMHVVVKGDLFEFIEFVRTENWILLCELRQYWF